MIHPTTITAPDEVIRTWKEAVARALYASRRADDPAVGEALVDAPREALELIAYLSDELTHAAGTLLVTVANATPGAVDAIHDGVRDLIDQVAAEQAGRTGGEEAPCPLPESDGSPRLCTCSPEGRRACGEAAFDAGRDELPLGDNGCEGGAR